MAIYARDAFACVYCGWKGTLDGAGLTLDHVEPRKRFGDNTTGNLLTSCLGCNLRKGARCVGEWAADEAADREARRRMYARVRRALQRPIPMLLGARLAEERAREPESA